MIFNDHSNLQGMHALLSPSSYHWLNYDEDKLIDIYNNKLQVEMGTRLHAFAEECINLNQKLPDTPKTLNLYVNDAIGYHMSPEVVLYYSENCFGTADSILYDESINTLRVHDLKTGQTPAHMEQLMIYCALFCLEYHVPPDSINYVTRIYQYDSYTEHRPSGSTIQDIMNKIIEFDKLITNEKEKLL